MMMQNHLKVNNIQSLDLIDENNKQNIIGQIQE